MNTIKVGDRVHVILYISDRYEKGFFGKVVCLPEMSPQNCWIFTDDAEQTRYVKYYIQIIKESNQSV